MYQIVQNKYCLPLAECLHVHPGWFKRIFSLFAIRGILQASFFISAKCRGSGLEIAGYKKRCSISELPVIRWIFLRSLTICLKVIVFAGCRKENKQREKMA